MTDTTTDEFGYWTPCKVFDGKTVFVVGGGNSVTPQMIQTLRAIYYSFENVDIIGANTLVEFPWIPYTLFSDKDDMIDDWFVKGYVKTYDGILIAHNDAYLNRGVVSLRRTPLFVSLKREFPYLCWTNNTGIGCILLSAMLGASNIALVGFDCNMDAEGNSNRSKGVQVNKIVLEKYLKYHTKFFPEFTKLYPDVSITNLNPQSSISEYEKCDFNNYIIGNFRQGAKGCRLE